jgi:TM2 domain-containing membrane protein YozV
MSKKSNLTALLLAIFLGGFGVHRFYVGRIPSGIIMLLLTLSFFGAFISGIWALIDLITIVCQQFKDNEDKILKWKN